MGEQIPVWGEPSEPVLHRVVLGTRVELLNRRRWNTRLELANAIFEYLEIFHNRRRRHSALGMLTATEYETINRTIHVARGSRLACLAPGSVEALVYPDFHAVAIPWILMRR
jgi:hypothetical protein